MGVDNSTGPAQVAGYFLQHTTPHNCTLLNTHIEGPHCPSQQDDLFNCWPATPVNTTVYKPCPFLPDVQDPEVHGFRRCLANGSWEHGNWSNYTVCLQYLDHMDAHTTESPQTFPQNNVQLFRTLTDIIFIASIISLVFLLVSLVIFSVFRSLQCHRISIHKHLVMSFIFRFIIHIITFEPFVTNRQTSYRDVEWLCRTLKALDNYMVAANFAWMFVEGLFLHNRLAVSVFSSEAPFALFYAIGWGIPGVLTVLWSTLMHFHNMDSCWSFSTESPLIFIVYAPIMVALVINLGFLVNIIRILVTKLRANNSLETARMRKTIKATVVLLPLLGMTNLLFFLKPHGENLGMVAYRVTNAVLPPCQGIFVSLLYCFMNGEVQGVIKKKWQRFRLSRSLTNSRSRRRSSRTSSVFLSQSEVLFMVSFRNKVFNKRHQSRDYSHPINNQRCTCLRETNECIDCSKVQQYG
ncbi:corticotropin-releasing factor receptor 1-like [Pomacea canaliculata]|uniref:corticotropin-releasing factor receptor 1-like n=1 Tax=Pomacea canaliculata TaxID=400727 RepID=UPI000D73BB96|nr:corticotropin-releasing factor receptor 1-like [Pomacea canaliculata]XP_025096176.1 corticotropin-releasing factor receptor 1-like [Pomacea canaliculata]XP_025096177.1 corticotropin-releasing factor receptor 1-like [Pomacea canaliculata]